MPCPSSPSPSSTPGHLHRPPPLAPRIAVSHGAPRASTTRTEHLAPFVSPIPTIIMSTMVGEPQSTTSLSQGHITILSAKDVDHVLSQPTTLQAALQSQAQVFRDFSTKQVVAIDVAPTGAAPVQMPDRIVTSSDNYKTLFMPSRIASSGGTGIKIVSVPLGSGNGLPASTIIIDESTGKISGIINARNLTALRNACGERLPEMVLSFEHS
jgi:hypothetical protein